MSVGRKNFQYVKITLPLFRAVVKNWILRIFFSFRNETSYHDAVVFKDERVIIPSKMSAEIEPILLQGHIGISKTEKK